MKVSRALVTLSCLAVPVAVEECFYLDFSLVSLGAVAEMSIYIFATVSMLPHAPPLFPPLCHSLFSAVQASALNLPVERHTYTWTKWSSSSNKNNSNKRRRRTEAIERNENNYESRAKPSQEPRAESSLSLSPSPTRSHWNSTHARAAELEAVQQVWLGVSVLAITFVTDFGWAIKWSSKCYYDCISGRIIVCQGITWLQLTLGILTMLPLARCRSCCGQKNLLPTIKLSVSGRQLELN